MSKLTVTGMVLSVAPAGESDKRVTILTKERGRISGFARGARRPNHPLLAPCSPFAFGTFEVYEGRSAYSISKAEIKNYFRSVVDDYDKVCLGSYFLEMADYFGVEGAEDKERLMLLYKTMEALEKGKIPGELIRSIYELKTITIEGEYPNVFSCVNCGKKEKLTHFSQRLKGCTCSECEKATGGVMINPAVLYAMQYIISTPASKVYSFLLPDEQIAELGRVIKTYMKSVVDHKFKSEDFL